MQGIIKIERLQGSSNIHQHIFCDAVALVANNPEDNAVALVNQLAALAEDPDVGESIAPDPLPVDIDGPRLAHAVNIEGISGAALDHLKDIAIGLELAYGNIAGTGGDNAGGGGVVGQLKDWPVSSTVHAIKSRMAAVNVASALLAGRALTIPARDGRLGNKR